MSTDTGACLQRNSMTAVILEIKFPVSVCIWEYISHEDHHDCPCVQQQLFWVFKSNLTGYITGLPLFFFLILGCNDVNLHLYQTFFLRLWSIYHSKTKIKLYKIYHKICKNWTFIIKFSKFNNLPFSKYIYNKDSIILIVKRGKFETIKSWF